MAGTEGQINAALASLSYQGTLHYNGADTLTVLSTDSAGTPLSDTDTVAITVTPVNDAPVNTVPGPQRVNEDTALALGGLSVTDVDGNLLTRMWSFTSVPVGSGAVLSDATAIMPTFVVDRPGIYVAQLIVNDGSVDSAPDTVSIATLNSAPVADAGIDQTVVAGATVLLDGSGSHDVDFDPLAFTWLNRRSWKSW